MTGDDVAGLYKELAKTVLETLDSDAEKQVLDDGEHIVRVRHVLEGVVGYLKSHGVVSREVDLIQRELKAFAVELFIRRCRAARAADGQVDSSEPESENREYFEKVYRSRKHA